jgi:hypothetical protein
VWGRQRTNVEEHKERNNLGELDLDGKTVKKDGV